MKKFIAVLLIMIFAFSIFAGTKDTLQSLEGKKVEIQLIAYDKAYIGILKEVRIFNFQNILTIYSYTIENEKGETIVILGPAVASVREIK